MTELSGTILEQRYELGRVMGAGGMGAVYEARQLRLDRSVAIKVLRPAFVGHQDYIRRFLREAKAASKIRHRNVVEILDYGETDGGLIYSVMEFLDGRDFGGLLRAQPNRRLPWVRTCGLLVQVASGLKAVHAAGVIHRDIKPANCFLTIEDEEPLVKIVDFGIAKVDDADEGHALTATAQVIGTPRYIAPELIRAQGPPSPRSDIYSLGVLAYRMLTGSEPFSSESLFDLFHQHCYGSVPALRERVPDLPVAIENFVLELLARDPANRPRNMAAVRKRLLELSTGILRGQAGRSVSSDVSSYNENLEQSRRSTQRTTIPRDEVQAAEDRSDGPGDVDEIDTDKYLAENLKSTFVLDEARSSGDTDACLGKGDTVPAVDEPASREVVGSQHHHGRALWVSAGVLALVIASAGVWALALDEDAGSVVPESRGKIANVGIPSRGEPVPAPKPERSSVWVPAPSGSSREDDEATNGTSIGNQGSVDSGTGEPGPVMGSLEPELEALAVGLTEPLKTRARRRKKAKQIPAGPPRDASVLRRLRKKIESRCGPMSEGVVTVSFFIKKNGEISSPAAVPRKGTGECAKEQVEGIRFRSRAKKDLKKIVFGQ